MRVLRVLENRRDHAIPGLNLTWEVLDGIAHHSGEQKAETLEGRLLKFADRIAYVNHDIDDSLRAGVLTMEDLPKESIAVLGETHSERISTMVNAIIEASFDKPDIAMEDSVYEASRNLRAFMFREVYTNEMVKGENTKLEHIMTDLLDYLVDHPDVMPIDHRRLYRDTAEETDVRRQAIDYIAGMTDDFLIRTYRNLFIPKAWSIL